MITELPYSGDTPAMRFILNGKLYDTKTSTPTAIARGAEDGNDADDMYTGALSVRYEDVLYRTTRGAFFLHQHRTVKYSKGKPAVVDTADALTPDEAVKWIARDEAMILDATGLELPEEA